MMDFDRRLGRLNARRQDASIDPSMLLVESYAKRTMSKAVKYTLGSMQEVDPRSTQISHEEAEKVERNLSEGLKKVGLEPDFRLQGSVAANTHIRGVSDVDLLCIEGVFLTIEKCEPTKKHYSDYQGRGTLVDDVLHLRSEAIKVLNTKFWGANVETHHDKSIALSGGAFRRKVDVVPSHWHDTVKYQQSLDETFRAVEIVNKSTREKIRNFPFLYISQLNQADAQTNGGTKMAIRLAKNLKNDSSYDIKLSSYDIGSVFYHCPNQQLSYLPTQDLKVLAGAEAWLSWLEENPIQAKELDTPDHTRKIIDTNEKWTGLKLLAQELRDLTDEVADDLGYTQASSYPHVTELRKSLTEARIPMVH